MLLIDFPGKRLWDSNFGDKDIGMNIFEGGPTIFPRCMLLISRSSGDGSFAHKILCISLHVLLVSFFFVL